MSADNPAKIFSWKTAVLIFIGVGLFALGAGIFIQASRNQIVENTDKAGPRLEATTTVAVGLGSSFEAPGQPIRLIIPVIGVDAAIQSVGLSTKGNGDMGVPTNFTDVAWYDRGPLPGMPGSAVIDGHLDGKNVPKAVFYSLSDLKPGDLVKVLDDKGKTLQFQVVGSQVYDYNATTTDIFLSDTTKSRLNLITCAGSWLKSQKLYNKRVVVFTELIKTD